MGDAIKIVDLHLWSRTGDIGIRSTYESRKGLFGRVARRRVGNVLVEKWVNAATGKTEWRLLPVVETIET